MYRTAGLSGTWPTEHWASILNDTWAYRTVSMKALQNGRPTEQSAYQGYSSRPTKHYVYETVHAHEGSEWWACRAVGPQSSKSTVEWLANSAYTITKTQFNRERSVLESVIQQFSPLGLHVYTCQIHIFVVFLTIQSTMTHVYTCSIVHYLNLTWLYTF